MVFQEMMDFSLEAISKNTFITIVDESLPKLPSPRSRSAETARNRLGSEELQELTQHSLQRLTTALKSGVLQPASPRGRQGSRTSSPPASPESTRFSSPQKAWDKHFRVHSSCSLSTMAPDDGSECGELVGVSRIKLVPSSNSISSMVSDLCLAEGEEIEFELDIEAGAVAAREEAAIDRPHVTPDVSQVTLEMSREEAPIDRPPGKVTPDMSHGFVPKTHNMAEMHEISKDEPPTTLMIRNIPGKYSQNDLMMDLKKAGFGSTYDFLYLPIDKNTSANVGYAFVNFVDPAVAAKCMQSFQGFCFKQHQRCSNKLARISVAHLQGLEKNLQYYEKAAVNAKKRRPVVVANMSKMFE